MVPTREIANEFGRDAGNRSRKKGGRDKWSLEDWNAAAREANRLHCMIDRR